MDFLSNVSSPFRRSRTARLATVAAIAISLSTAATAPASPVSGPQAGDELVERERARERAAIDHASSPAERERRHASRRAFRGLSRGEALALARDRHPEFVALPAWRAPALALGHRIVGYVDDFLARVEGADGTGSHLLASSVPMRAAGDGGEKRPVDLSLERAGDGFRPVNPLADVHLGSRLSEGLRLTRTGLVVRPVVEAEPDPVLSGDTLFYAGALKDADVLVRPEVGGFGVHVQIRSEDAPERFALELDVPAGVELEEFQHGGIVRIVREGKVIGGITAPLAFDADRRPIDLTWRLEGRRLEIDVPHRGADLAYPLLVDPSAVETFEWERYGTNGQYGNFEGWKYSWTGPFQNHAWAGDSTWLGAGMYIRNLGTSYTYADGHHGKWVWRAPGFGRLWQVEWNLVDQDAVDGTEIELGVVRHPVDESLAPTWWTGTGNPARRTDVFHGAYFRTCSMTCLAGSGAPGDEAQFSLVARGGRNRSYFAAQVGVVYLHMTDSDIPVIGAGLPDRWVDWPAEKALDVWAVDSTTGVSQMTLSATGWKGATIGPNTYVRCKRTYVCPRAHATDGATDNALVADMPEGVNTLAVTTKDASGSQKTAAGTIVHAGQGLRGHYYDDTEFRTLVGERLDPQVDFNWGLGTAHPGLEVNKSGDANSFSVRWSGYVTAPETGTYTFQTSTDDGVRLWVDNLNTPIIDDWRVRSEAQRTGTVTLQADTRYRIVLEYFESQDNAVARLRWRLPSRPTTEAPVAIPSSRLSPPSAWTFKLDRSAPDIQPTGPLKDLENQELPPGQYKLVVDATDGSTASAAQQRSGVRTVDIMVDGDRVDGAEQECAAGNCAMHREYTFDTEKVPGGEHTILIEATDQLGHVGTRSFKVRTRCCMRDAAQWGTFDTAYDWQLADVDGDHRADVVGRHSSSGNVRVARSTGQAFAASQSWGNVPVAQQLHVADVSGDGRADLVARDSGGTVRVSLSTGTAFAAAATWGTWSMGMDVHLADVDQEPGADLVGRDDASDEVRVGLSNGVSFAPAVKWLTVADGHQIAVADVDDDDMADLVVRNQTTNAVQVGRSLQTSFGALAPWGTWTHAGSLNARDFHGDAMAELWAFDSVLGTLTVAASNGTSFLAGQRWGTLTAVHGAPRLGDVDGDAMRDVLQRTTTGQLNVHLSSAMGPVIAASEPYTPAAGDLYDDSDEFPPPPTQPSGTVATRQHTPCAPVGPSLTVQRAAPRLAAQDDDVFLGAATTDAARTRRDLAYTRLQQAGVSIIRFTANWGHIEADQAMGGAAQYNWEPFLIAINEAKCRGFDVYVTLTGAAKNGLDCNYDFWGGQSAATDPSKPHPYGCANDDPMDSTDGEEPGYTGFARTTLDYLGRTQLQAWRQFVASALQTFSAPSVPWEHRVNIYGVWNEPNLPNFLRDGSAVNTAAFYRQLYDAARSEAAGYTRLKLLFGELSEINRGAVTTAEFIERVATTTNPLITDGIAIHPYQHRAMPRQREGRRFGIGRLREINDTVRQLFQNGRLLPPAGAPRRIPRVYGTEFGYWNRQFDGKGPNTWHAEVTRAGRLNRVLTLAREHRLRWFTLYQVTEKTPAEGIGATACEADVYDQSQPVRYGAGIWDMGLIGQSGEVDGTRCYGRTPPGQSGNERLNVPQSRSAFCTIVRWARRENLTAAGRGQPMPYAVAPGTTMCP